MWNLLAPQGFVNLSCFRFGFVHSLKLPFHEFEIRLSLAPDHASLRSMPRRRHDMDKHNDATRQRGRSKKHPAAEPLGSPFPEQASLSPSVVGRIQMALYQPLNDEIDQTGN